MSDVLTLTLNPAVDANTSAESVTPERKLRCEAPRFEPGGGGINVSRVLQRLEVPSRAAYFAGGAHGELLRRLLDAEGLEQRALPIEGLTRENLIVLERASGQQYRFGLPGPEVAQAEWADLLDALSGVRPRPAYVVASGSLPPGLPDDAFAVLAEAARELEARFVLDTSGPPLRRGVEAGAYLIKPNLGEFRTLVGEDLPHHADQVRAARRLVADGRVHVVVVSLGAGGTLWVDADGAHHLPAPTVPVRSKVGAGDSMVGGIVAGLTRGLEALDVARLGVAAGAAAVMTPGTELCRREDVERLYADLRAWSDGPRA